MFVSRDGDFEGFASDVLAMGPDIHVKHPDGPDTRTGYPRTFCEIVVMPTDPLPALRGTPATCQKCIARVAGDPNWRDTTLSSLSHLTVDM